MAPRHLWLEATLVFILVAGARCLRNVSLEVVPEAVQRGQEVILRCHYDLERAPLYSVKWYRGRYEFYRYSPTEEQTNKIFNITGIHVDAGKSNNNEVTLHNVDFALSGTFSCEVTADAPTFSTASATKNLTVVSLPEGKPFIVSDRERYDLGDTLRANCSLPASRPTARLSFALNNIPVAATSRNQEEHEQQKREHRREGTGVSSEQQQQQHQQQQWIALSLPLQPFHYSNGQLNLRCNAQIPGIYSSMNELQLGAGLREPVPERVTSENGCKSHSAVCLTILLLLCMVQLLLR
ncbi:uncharacterized protein LOC122634494 [Vespula pensylvanica]|uniref:uncharacterized protein LOC122634494 n=1 Tax=Vespula pensylvanica TaxID=30213 RepID=UPI001CB9E724|nr:uncharacterized protein LOC122634494 [Vespula pensylvanica]XP_050862375.1 uncharacterized protein LOC127069412 [Vespula vulgaris]